MTEQERIEQLIIKKLNEKDSRYSRMDEFEWLQYQRKQTQKKLKKSRARLKASYKELTQKSQPVSKLEKLAMWLDRSKMIIQGAQVGYGLLSNIKGIFKLRKTINGKR